MRTMKRTMRSILTTFLQILKPSLHLATKTLVIFLIFTIIKIEPDSEETWIEWFCKKRGHEFLCEVDKAFFEDASNLSNL
jgi:hypothetical protein